MTTESAIARIKFSIDCLDNEMANVTGPLSNLVSEGACEVVASRTPSLQSIRAKIAIGKLHQLRDLMMSLKHDSIFWDNVLTVLNAPHNAESLVVEGDGAAPDYFPAA